MFDDYTPVFLTSDGILDTAKMYFGNFQWPGARIPTVKQHLEEQY